MKFTASTCPGNTERRSPVGGLGLALGPDRQLRPHGNSRPSAARTRWRPSLSVLLGQDGQQGIHGRGSQEVLGLAG